MIYEMDTSYYLESCSGRLLSKDGVSYTESICEAMKFYTWEEAYSHNCENFSGSLNEISDADL